MCSQLCKISSFPEIFKGRVNYFRQGGNVIGLFVCMSVCLYVCMYVSRISQTAQVRFGCNLIFGLLVGLMTCQRCQWADYDETQQLVSQIALQSYLQISISIDIQIYIYIYIYRQPYRARKKYSTFGRSMVKVIDNQNAFLPYLWMDKSYRCKSNDILKCLAREKFSG